MIFSTFANNFIFNGCIMKHGISFYISIILYVLGGICVVVGIIQWASEEDIVWFASVIVSGLLFFAMAAGIYLLTDISQGIGALNKKADLFFSKEKNEVDKSAPTPKTITPEKGKSINDLYRK
jgi:hypothetical protein